MLSHHRFGLVLIVAATCLIGVRTVAAQASHPSKSSQKVVLVELFTSQG